MIHCPCKTSFECKELVTQRNGLHAEFWMFFTNRGKSMLILYLWVDWWCIQQLSGCIGYIVAFPLVTFRSLSIDVIHVVQCMSLTEDGTRKGWTSAIARAFLVQLSSGKSLDIVWFGAVNLLLTAFEEMVFMFYHFLGVMLGYVTIRYRTTHTVHEETQQFEEHWRTIVNYGYL